MGNIGEKLNARIKRLRVEAGLSQVALATHADCSVQTIKDIEGGRKGVGLKVIKGISRALGILVEELTGIKEPAVQKVSRIKMSQYTKAIESIPDDVYVLAAQINDPENQVWDAIRGYLDDEIKYGNKTAKGREG